MEGPDVFCIPVKEEKKKIWRVLPGPLFGQGSYGDVHAACKNSECSYVMKIVVLGKKTSVSAFDKEVEMQRDVAAAGLTIPVEDSWKCRNPPKIGVIIMKSLDITLRDFLNENITQDDVDAVLLGAKELIKDLHSFGYFHADNHFGNIMMKRIYRSGYKDTEANNHVVSTSFGYYRMYLIDFGKAGRLAEPGVYPRGVVATKERRMKEDRVILDGEIRQTMAKFRPETIESLII